MPRINGSSGEYYRRASRGRPESASPQPHADTNFEAPRAIPLNIQSRLRATDSPTRGHRESVRLSYNETSTLPAPTRTLVEKIQRLAAGGAPRTLDLFCGCGGLSLGLEAAGFDVRMGLDADRAAVSTYYANLRKPTARITDPCQLDSVDEPRRTLAARGWPHAADTVDVISGGPPCQAFARIGRAKLRRLRDEATDALGESNAWNFDERANLYEHLLRFVAALQPVAVLIENVPDIFGYRPADAETGIAALRCVPDVMVADLDDLGYSVRYTLLNAAHYGVPQYRERFFLLAIHRLVARAPSFPMPGRSVELPVGYGQIRKKVFGRWTGSEQQPLFDSEPVLLDPAAEVAGVLPPPVTTAEALSDLPPLYPLADRFSPGIVGQERARLYPGDIPLTSYQLMMRDWEINGRASDRVTAHAIRLYLKRKDNLLFRGMQPGDCYPEAIEIAERLFAERVAAGGQPEVGSPAWIRIREETVPPYPVDKFPDKWRKLDPDTPSHTLTAHLGRDTYSHIHYDGRQARTISVREAARLQSFPDAFHFPGGMNDSFRQIGNAVPPLLAKEIGALLLKLLGRPAVI